MRNIAGAIDFFYPHIGSVSFPKFMTSHVKTPPGPLWLFYHDSKKAMSGMFRFMMVCYPFVSFQCQAFPT